MVSQCYCRVGTVTRAADLGPAGDTVGELKARILGALSDLPGAQNLVRHAHS
jgi:hypothetical protein